MATTTIPNQRHDKLISFKEATHHCQGATPHWMTLYRWATRGVRGVRLRTTRRGHRRLTTAKWIDEFLRELDRMDGYEPVDTTKSEASVVDELDRELAGKPKSKGSEKTRARRSKAGTKRATQATKRANAKVC